MAGPHAVVSSLRRPAREAGFTLLEVLVAVAIFALGSVAVLAIRSNSFKEAAAADTMNLARFLLQRKMEEVLLEPDRYKDGDEGTFDEPEFARFTWGVEIEEITLIGGSDEDGYGDGTSSGRSGRAEEETKRADLSGSGRNEGDDGAFGGEEPTEVIVYQFTVYIWVITAKGEKHYSASTYLPSDRVADEELF